jgi:hypothetical protein
MRRILVIVFCMVNVGCASPLLMSNLPSTGASLGVHVVTGKSPTDHILSAVTGMDCKTLRIFSEYKNEYICEPEEPEQKVYQLRGLEKISKL